MALEDWEILTHDKIRALIEANKETDPIRFALTHNNNEFPLALVSTQLKSLQKARLKLPSWYKVSAILPPLALEQCSSEATAKLKSHTGKIALDLSGGLGVDSHFLSQGFTHLISLEPQKTLSAIQRYNLQLLKNPKVEVINQDAESFLQSYDGPKFDLIYVDPSRRDHQNRRINALTEGAPNITQLMPLVRQHGHQLLIKASPLLDLTEAHRLFPTLKELVVVSKDNECKEVLIWLDKLSPTRPEEPSEALLRLKMLRQGILVEYQFSYPLVEDDGCAERSSPPAFLSEPDVAFYKSRSTKQLLASLKQNGLSLPHRDGYIYSNQPLASAFPGRQFKVIEMMPYKPKAIKKWLKANKIKQLNISKRNFPETVAQARKQLQLSEGGKEFLLLSLWQGNRYAFFAERIQ
ncbi:MAG: class I SAM-dependent methyltransferase [Bacteroidota bacterium]